MRHPSLRTGLADLPHPALQSWLCRFGPCGPSLPDIGTSLPTQRQARRVDVVDSDTPRFGFCHPVVLGPCGSSPCGQSLALVGRGNFLPWFHFLPPFAPPVVTRLRSAVPDFPASVFPRLACATMPALTSAGSLAASCPGRSPTFTPTPLPDILPPTTRTSPTTANASLHRWPSLVATGLRHFLAGSPICSGRIVFIVFIIFAVCQVPSIALHPASRRRSYFKFSARMRPKLAGVSHSGGG